jgi:large subunit ribosomal protein L3
LATEDQKNKSEVEKKGVDAADEVLESVAESLAEGVQDAPQEASSDDDGSAALPFVVGKKAGMTRIFDENGRDYPATVVEIVPCYVTQVKTVESDGYSSVQLGYNESSDKKVKNAQKGHVLKSGVSGLRNFKEFRTESNSDVKLGSKVDSSIFELGDFIAVTGVSKGRGFAGHMKRHGFGGGRRSHGKNSVMRKPGSIGAGSDPSRVWLGTRMAGRFGNDRVTVKNLEVIRVDSESNLVFIKGAVPGAKNGFIYLVK